MSRQYEPAVIDKALELPSFEYDEVPQTFMTGFFRNALMAAAPAVNEGVKDGDIRHFFLIGGFDGDKAERSYYKEFMESVPQGSLILTLACGKFKLDRASCKTPKAIEFPGR